VVFCSSYSLDSYEEIRNVVSTATGGGIGLLASMDGRSDKDLGPYETLEDAKKQ
jgi:hypothetical protein